MSHSAEKDAPYEACVIDASNNCTRWSHDHETIEDDAGLIRCVEVEI